MVADYLGNMSGIILFLLCIVHSIHSQPKECGIRDDSQYVLCSSKSCDISCAAEHIISIGAVCYGSSDCAGTECDTMEETVPKCAFSYSKSERLAVFNNCSGHESCSFLNIAHMAVLPDDCVFNVSQRTFSLMTHECVEERLIIDLDGNRKPEATQLDSKAYLRFSGFKSESEWDRIECQLKANRLEVFAELVKIGGSLCEETGTRIFSKNLGTVQVSDIQCSKAVNVGQTRDGQGMLITFSEVDDDKFQSTDSVWIKVFEYDGIGTTLRCWTNSPWYDEGWGFISGMVAVGIIGSLVLLLLMNACIRRRQYKRKKLSDDESSDRTSSDRTKTPKGGRGGKPKDENEDMWKRIDKKADIINSQKESHAVTKF